MRQIKKKHMIEEEKKSKFILELKKAKTNSSINYNDKLVIKLNFRYLENWWGSKFLFGSLLLF